MIARLFVSPFLFFLLFVALFFFVACQTDENDDQPGWIVPPDNTDPYYGSNTHPDEFPGGLSFDREYEREILKRFEPALIQGLAEDYDSLPYPQTSDQIGQLSLHIDGTEYEYSMDVDTDIPVIYAFARLVRIRHNYHYQLVYAFSYPERPIPFDIGENLFQYILRYVQSGAIDGKIVRITLDANNEIPLFVEVVRNCGCSWQLYVNKLVDDEARAEFEGAGIRYPGLVKSDAPHDTQYVWVLSENVEGAPDQIVIVAEQGWGESPHHALGAFTSYEQWFFSKSMVKKGALYLPDDKDVYIFEEGPLKTRYYTLLDYDLLYHMSPYGTDKDVGIFDPYNYVWNSYSPWNKFLFDLGLSTTFPGTPIDPQYLEVVHETIDFWNPGLLFETFLYLPLSLFGMP